MVDAPGPIGYDEHEHELRLKVVDFEDGQSLAMFECVQCPHLTVR